MSSVKQRLQEKQREEVERSSNRNKNEASHIPIKRRQDFKYDIVKDPPQWAEAATRTKNSPTKDVKHGKEFELRHVDSSSERKKECSSSSTNSNITKGNNNLLKQDEIHKLEQQQKSEKSDSSSSILANSTKWDKFKSHLKRTFQTDQTVDDEHLLEVRPQKLSKLDDSSAYSISNLCSAKDLNKDDASQNIAEKEVERSGEHKRSSSSSASRTPSPSGSNHSSPTSGLSVALPLKHRHYHHRKAMVVASTLTTTTPPTKVLTSNNNSNSNSNNLGSNNKETECQEKDKKNTSEPSTSAPPLPSTPTTPSNAPPFKANTKKKQKSKYLNENKSHHCTTMMTIILRAINKMAEILSLFRIIVVF